VETLKSNNTAHSNLDAFKKLPKEVREQCKKTALEVGNIIKNTTKLTNHKDIRLRNRGFFEVNAILTKKNKVLITEINAFFTGSSKILNILYKSAHLYGIYEQVYRAFKGEPLDLQNFKSLRRIIREQNNRLFAINTYDVRNLERTFIANEV
jgi:hypothetical protein